MNNFFKRLGLVEHDWDERPYFSFYPWINKVQRIFCLHNFQKCYHLDNGKLSTMYDMWCTKCGKTQKCPECGGSGVFYFDKDNIDGQECGACKVNYNKSESWK